MARSEKPIIIEHLFFQRYDKASGTLSDPIVTNVQLREAKQYCKVHMGTTMDPDGNAYNFMKDIVRGRGAAKNWPESILALGYLGRQRTGSGAIFEFYSFTESEQRDLEENISYNETTLRVPVQSVSMPLAARQLGRRDESWLLQVCVNLRIIETHLVVGENRQADVVEVTHLQMDLKLRDSQIDALFLASFLEPDGTVSPAIVTLEAKQAGQRILKEQMARQVRAAFSSTQARLVIPLAVSAVPGEGIYVAEFKAVKDSEIEAFDLPVFHRDALFVLEPPVKGISLVARAQPRKRGKSTQQP